MTSIKDLVAYNSRMQSFLATNCKTVEAFINMALDKVGKRQLTDYISRDPTQQKLRADHYRESVLAMLKNEAAVIPPSLSMPPYYYIFY
jgi:hypothetical protein